MPYLSDAGDQVKFAGEQMATEEMRFDSRQAESESIFTEGGHRIRIGQQRRARALVYAPGARRRHVDARVRVSQALVVGGEIVAAFGLRKKARKGAPCLEQHSATAGKKPFDFLAPAQQYPAPHEPGARQRLELA